MNNFKNKLVIFIFVVVLLGTIFLFIVYQQKRKVVFGPVTPIRPEIETAPTLTPEEVEIIRKVETHEVFIEEGKVTPKTLEIKVHDQVRWFNKEDKIHRIIGEGWGDVPIGPGENFIQPFNQPGTYTYTDKEDPNIKGTIIVK